MSRAYRIKVNESLRRVIRAKDHVSTQLEVLEILPPEQMAELLAAELIGRGFQRQGKALVRQEKGVTIRVEPETGTVTVQAEAGENLELQAEKEGRAYDDWGRTGQQRVKEDLRKELRQDLEKQAGRKAADLQKRVTEQLEGNLADLRKELDHAVNRATAEALKRKAAQIGQIKELTEDPQSGSLTIVLEV